jgi:DNA-binding NarL/FixJ family response regulator
MIDILIVEDNAEFREMLKVILQSGFPFARISEAGEGNAALREVKRRKPDLIFMDIRMPGKSGIVLTGEIKKRHLDIVVIVLTQHDTPEYREAAFANGADYFLSKESVKAEEIQELVKTIIAERREQ